MGVKLNWHKISNNDMPPKRNDASYLLAIEHKNNDKFDDGICVEQGWCGDDGKFGGCYGNTDETRKVIAWADMPEYE